MLKHIRSAFLAATCLAAAVAIGPAFAADDELITLTTSLEGSGQDVMTSSVHGQDAYWDEMYDWTVEQDASGALSPGLATKWYPSDDKLTWTFEIRDGVKFHNGTT